VTRTVVASHGRYWFYYLASSLIVFFAGVIVILSWRIIDHFAGCGLTAAVSGRSRTTDDDSTLANVAARIRWKCEKLVSGQTPVGRILASSTSISVLVTQTSIVNVCTGGRF